MDALGRKTCGTTRTVKPCGSGSPMLESSLRIGDVGLRPGTPRRRWWLKSPAHQEEHGAAVKPLRRECRSDFGVPVLACVRLFVLHAWQWVRRAPGIPCALCVRGSDKNMQHSDANRAAGMRSHVSLLSSRASGRFREDDTGGGCEGSANQKRSPLLTIFCHCGASAFSSRTTARRARQPSVNGFGRRFQRHPRVRHVDSQRYFGNSGRGRSLACDFRCLSAHPASRAPASYLPLRADWAFAPGHSGVV